jgi:hypothetical protein
MEFWMMNFLKQFEVEVSAWLNISAHPHRFGGRKFLFGSAEVGHIHAGGIVDIPFSRSVPQFKFLLGKFVPATATRAATERLTA